MKKRGVVLVAVLLVAALVALIAVGVMFRMRAETSVSAATVRGEQAWQAARSGLDRVIALLKVASADMKIWYDNPDLLANQPVADDGSYTWYFTVWAEDVSQQAPRVRYGVVDESGKIGLNAATAETLLKLPNMTNALVDCLLDWRDADSTVRPEGAEQDYYDQLETPYLAANGPFSSLDELLLAKGFTARLVYGEDANLNGLLDPNEDDGDDSFPPDNRDGVLDRGLRGLATVVSAEPNVDNAGQARIGLNSAGGSSGRGGRSRTDSGGASSADGETDGSGTDAGADDSGAAAGGAALAGAGLPRKTLDFIRLYQAEGNTFKHPSELLEMKYTLKQTNPGNPAQRAGTEIDSGVGAAELPLVMDRLTTAPTGTTNPLRGLVNINTAPAEVLAVLPGMDAGLAQQIVEARGNLDADTRATTAWLYTQNLVDAAAFKAVAPYITTRSLQFSVRCLGYGVPNGTSAAQAGMFRVLEAVVDLSGTTPRIIYLRDITRLGLPFPVSADVQVEGSPQ
jgi:type II secretory pathway component PulK